MQTRAFAAATTNVIPLPMSYVKPLPVVFKNPMPLPSSTYPTTMMTRPPTRMPERIRPCPPPFSQNGKPSAMSLLVNSTTYALTHSSAASLMPSLIVNDDDDNQMMIKASDAPTPTNSFDKSLCKLCHSVRELEKVNQQFAQLLESLDERDPCQPNPHLDINLQQPPLCPAPQLECTPQNVLPIVPPLAPNPPASPIMACQLKPPKDQTPRLARGTLPCAYHQEPTTATIAFPPTPPTSKTTIPNWARPAIPPPASSRLMAGLFGAGKSHWPPP